MSIDDAALADLRERLPLRAPRRFVAEDSLENVPAPPAFSADAGLSREERASLGRAVTSALGAAVGRLEPQDRLLVRLRFYDGVTVADIARLQRVEQKPLYRRLEGILGRLRAALRDAGFHESAIADVLREGEPACD
jgi:RNA polymerase sigma factor for flagellar operon FliA